MHDNYRNNNVCNKTIGTLAGVCVCWGGDSPDVRAKVTVGVIDNS